MKKQFRNVMTVLALAVPMVSAHADFIDITFSGIADFEIGGQTFENAAFTVRTTADTSKLFLTSPPFSSIDVLQYDELAGLLSVEGFGNGNFTKPIAVFSNPSGQVAGLMAYAQLNSFSQVFEVVDLLDLRGPQMATYDLKSELLLDAAEFYDPQQWYQVDTSFGKMTAFNFEAVKMQVTASAVPESSTAFFFALGASLMAGAGVLRGQARHQPR